MFKFGDAERELRESEAAKRRKLEDSLANQVLQQDRRKQELQARVTQLSRVARYVGDSLLSQGESPPLELSAAAYKTKGLLSRRQVPVKGDTLAQGWLLGRFNHAVRYDDGESPSGRGTVSYHCGVILTKGGVLGIAKRSFGTANTTIPDSGSVWPIDYDKVVPETLDRYPSLKSYGLEQMLVKFAVNRQISLSEY